MRIFSTHPQPFSVLSILLISCYFFIHSHFPDDIQTCENFENLHKFCQTTKQKANERGKSDSGDLYVKMLRSIIHNYMYMYYIYINEKWKYKTIESIIIRLFFSH